MRPLTLVEIEATFKKWGVPYTVVSGAATRDNGSKWGTRDLVTGVMYHHTASDAVDSIELASIVNGRSSLPGPLCNFGAGDDGKIYVVAVGSANHAGRGDPETLALVQQEKTPLDSEVKPNENQSSPRAISGNSRFYGWESFYGIRNDPTPNPIQHRSTVLSMAAIIDKLDELDKANTWSGRAAIGHREWTTNKIDPSAVKMHEVRQLINTLRAKGPEAAKIWHKTGVMPGTTGSMEEDMAGIEVVNPRSGEKWPLAGALWSIWTYVLNANDSAAAAAKDAKIARELAEASAKGETLTAEQIAALADRVGREVAEELAGGLELRLKDVPEVTP